MNKTVLVVDDSPTICKVASFVLGAAGYDVIKARDGASALAELDDRCADLIIAEHRLADMDGEAFIDKLKKRAACESVPVVLLVDQAAGEKPTPGFASGAGAWMIKPFHPEQLLAVVAKLMPV